MTKNNVKNKTKNYSRISLYEQEIVYKFYREKKSQTEISKIAQSNKSSMSKNATLR